MDSKITKKRLFQHLESDWVKYVAVILVCIFGWYFVFMEININREFEVINVFFTCYDTNDTKLGAEFEDYLEEKGDTVIRDVRVAYKDPMLGGYNQLLTAEGFIDDIIILSKEDLFTYSVQFVPIEGEVLDACVPKEMQDDLEYFTYTEEGRNPDRIAQSYLGKRLGIRIDNLPKLLGSASPFIFDLSVLNPDMTEEELAPYQHEFYIVMNRRSLHVGEYGRKKKYRDLTQSYDFINFFLTKYGAVA